MAGFWDTLDELTTSGRQKERRLLEEENLLRRRMLEREDDRANDLRMRMDRYTAGEFDAQPAGFEQSSGITWNQARPEDKISKENLIRQVAPESYWARETEKMFPTQKAPLEVAPNAALVDPVTRKEIYRNTGGGAHKEGDVKDFVVGTQTIPHTYTKGEWVPMKGMGGPRFQEQESWRRLNPEQAAAEGLPKGGTYEISNRGQTRAVVNPTKEMGPGAMKLAQAEIGATGVLYGLDKFESAIREAPDGAQMEAFFGGLTPQGQKINTAWTNAALLAKGEELYALGVLSGPDLDIIQKALPDPSTKGGAIKNKETYYTAINEVRDLLNARLQAARKAYGGDGGAPNAIAESDRPKGAPTSARKAKNGRYYSPDPNRPGKYIEW